MKRRMLGLKESVIDYEKVVSLGDLTAELNLLLNRVGEVVDRKTQIAQWQKRNLRRLSNGIQKTEQELAKIPDIDLDV